MNLSVPYPIEPMEAESVEELIDGPVEDEAAETEPAPDRIPEPTPEDVSENGVEAAEEETVEPHPSS